MCGAKHGSHSKQAAAGSLQGRGWGWGCVAVVGIWSCQDTSGRVFWRLQLLRCFLTLPFRTRKNLVVRSAGTRPLQHGWVRGPTLPFYTCAHTHRHTLFRGKTVCHGEHEAKDLGWSLALSATCLAGFAHGSNGQDHKVSLSILVSADCPG